jgi:lysophospholipase
MFMIDAERQDAAAPEPIDRRAIPAEARESFWHTSDGHAIRRIDWNAAPLPDSSASHPAAPQAVEAGSVLFLPGRGDNYEKYLESLEQLHRQGWRVTASDWRGQAGSGRLGDDAVTGHIADFSIWVSDLAQLWADWIKQTPPPHVIAAHSMGGHLVLRALTEGVIDPDGAILIAPMLRMSGPALPMPVLHLGAKLMSSIGSPKRPAWKWSEKPGELPARRRELLTHDDDRYEDEIWWRKERPELVMGPGSWRWVERAYASVKVTERRGAMEAVDTPVLIVSTSADRLVSHAANERAARRLKAGEICVFGEEARHEILREVDPVRDRAMDAIASFLGRLASSYDGASDNIILEKGLSSGA